MALPQGIVDRTNEIRRLRDSGLTYKAIGEKYGITIERARQIYQKSIRDEKFEKIEKAFPGLAWHLAYGLYEEDITTVEELKQLTHEELFGVMNHAYPFRDNYEWVRDIENYIGR